MQSDLRVGTAQFEHRDNDPAYNLSRIDLLCSRAAGQGAQIASFHECSISGYTYLQHLGRRELEALAEPVPGPSTQALRQIAANHRLIVMAGLIEIDPAGHLYNTYLTVGPEGLISRFRKLHPFIHPDLSPGEGHQVVDLLGAKAGFLICYDNNLPENARVTRLMGAEILFAPHVTGCTPSPMPGRGPVDPALWNRRHADPATLRAEFDGPKGRGWLLKWLPARAWENGMYLVFSNPVGVDGGTIKPGLSMVIDPFGEVQAECRSFEDEIVVTTIAAEKFTRASGPRYLKARRPDLYSKLTEPPPDGSPSRVDPGWKLAHR